MAHKTFDISKRVKSNVTFVVSMWWTAWSTSSIVISFGCFFLLNGGIYLNVFFLSGEEDEVLLASILAYGIYSHHCAARHSSSQAHIESKASIARLIGELSVNKQVSQIWYDHCNFYYGR